MADGIDFRVFAEPFYRMIADRERRMPNAARWAVREAGRVAKRAARAETPVLKDSSLASHRQLRRRARLGEDVRGFYISGHDEKGRTLTAGTQPIPGLLKASISSSRNLKRLGDAEYSLKIGPRGARVHLYAGKIEDRAHYMEAGEKAAKVAMSRIARDAFARVWRG